MSDKIPHDYQAARDLARQFRALGEARASSTAPERGRARRWRWTRRGGGLALVAAGVAITGAGAAKVIVDQDAPIRGDRGEPRDLRRAPGDRRLSQAQADNPTGGLPWGARTYVNEQGRTCVVVGRLLGGRLGVEKHRRFSALPDDAPGDCASRDPASPTVNARMLVTPDVAAVYGYVSREFTRVELLLPGRTLPLPIADDGVYLTVVHPAALVRGARVRITGRGRSVVRRVG